MVKMKKIYLANGLFTEADRAFNLVIYNKLVEAGFEVYAPQLNSKINDKVNTSATSVEIFDADTNELHNSDIIFAVLDDEDIGVAAEIGYVAAFNALNENKKVMVGLYTDIRDLSRTYNEDKTKESVSRGIGESQYSYRNLYVVGAIKKYGEVFSTVDECINYIKNK